MIFRKIGLGAVIISLALLLSSCVEVKGEISVSSAARFNGELTYTLDKSFAAAAGIASLADINAEASSSEDPIDFCKGVPFIEDSASYILKCSLKDALAESGDITASIVGSNIVFRYKANLDATSDQTNFGSASLTVRFLDPVISYKENKVGLVKRLDDLTYQISGFATEPIDVEITANCSSRCGITNPVPAPEPSNTISPADAKAAADLLAKQEADAKAAADLLAKQEADAKAAADLLAKQEADAKAAADKAAADLKAKQDADAKAAADLKAKQEADAKAAADLKAKQEADAKAAADLLAKQEAEAKAAADKAAADKAAADKAAADAKAKAAKILADAKAKAAAAKKKTITCVKGKLVKKVTAVKPVCPKGYKKK
jgi:DNA segregation ATPase FtsK/SpoIIIE-like protein